MDADEGQRVPVPVVFTGSRWQLAGILLRGYLLMVPTIGLYRFWVTTWKRRFYWSNTEIDGDGLEYTGNALQLLVGFLYALAIFIPLYGVFFYLSTQSSEAAVIGYGAVALVLWYMAGYAIYRARDFRLSRTLWRGIRFDQAGNAWGYASRRFAWSIAMGITVGLIYPFMAANLWRYRYNHSWYGDRQFACTGSARQLLGPFYLSYVLVAVIGLATAGAVAGLGGFETANPNPVAAVPGLLGLALGWIVVINYQSREMTRMFSAVTLGEASLAVTIKARGLFAQYALFGAALVVAYVVLAIGGVVVLTAVAGDAFANGEFNPALIVPYMRGSLVTTVAIIIGYLLIVATFSLLSELFLGLGFWKLVARGAQITNIDTLRTVRARGEDKALAGEGLADALNVGAY